VFRPGFRLERKWKKKPTRFFITSAVAHPRTVSVAFTITRITNGSRFLGYFTILDCIRISSGTEMSSAFHILAQSWDGIHRFRYYQDHVLSYILRSSGSPSGRHKHRQVLKQPKLLPRNRAFQHTIIHTMVASWSRRLCSSVGDCYHNSKRLTALKRRSARSSPKTSGPPLAGDRNQLRGSPRLAG
jgi:hypothetical protein